MEMIEVKNLKKSFGNIEAVKGIDFQVRKGQLFAFLGCNGAGKSTTIDMLCTFLKPDEGEVWIQGYQLQHENEEIRKSIGIVFQESLLDDSLTIEENMKVRAALYGLRGKELQKAVIDIMKMMHIDQYAHRFYGTLSGGQKRKCDIARAFLHQPQILFLDEPTTGLDPQTRQEVWNTIYNLQEKYQLTIFLTTHYMEEAMSADYVVIMDEGKIVAKGTPLQLRKQYTKDKLVMTSTHKELLEWLENNQIFYDRMNSEIIVWIQNTLEALPILNECKQYIEDFEVTRGSMNDAFIQITGKELHL